MKETAMREELRKAIDDLGILERAKGRDHPLVLEKRSELEQLSKTWSEEARAAAAEARGKGGGRKEVAHAKIKVLEAAQAKALDDYHQTAIEKGHDHPDTQKALAEHGKIQRAHTDALIAAHDAAYPVPRRGVGGKATWTR